MFWRQIVVFLEAFKCFVYKMLYFLMLLMQNVAFLLFCLLQVFDAKYSVAIWAQEEPRSNIFCLFVMDLK